MYGLEHEQHHFSSLDSIQSLPVMLAKGGYRTPEDMIVPAFLPDTTATRQELAQY